MFRDGDKVGCLSQSLQVGNSTRHPSYTYVRACARIRRVRIRAIKINRRDGPGSCFLKVRHYTKGTSRTKIRPSHVKIIVLGCRSFILKKKKKMEKTQFGRFPYIPIAMVSSYFVSVFR